MGRGQKKWLRAAELNFYFCSIIGFSQNKYSVYETNICATFWAYYYSSKCKVSKICTLALREILSCAFNININIFWQLSGKFKIKHLNFYLFPRCFDCRNTVKNIQISWYHKKSERRSFSKKKWRISTKVSFTKEEKYILHDFAAIWNCSSKNVHKNVKHLRM